MNERRHNEWLAFDLKKRQVERQATLSVSFDLRLQGLTKEEIALSKELKNTYNGSRKLSLEEKLALNREAQINLALMGVTLHTNACLVSSLLFWNLLFGLLAKDPESSTLIPFFKDLLANQFTGFKNGVGVLINFCQKPASHAAKGLRFYVMGFFLEKILPQEHPEANYIEIFYKLAAKNNFALAHQKMAMRLLAPFSEAGKEIDEWSRAEIAFHLSMTLFLVFHAPYVKQEPGESKSNLSFSLFHNGGKVNPLGKFYAEYQIVFLDASRTLCTFLLQKKIKEISWWLPTTALLATFMPKLENYIKISAYESEAWDTALPSRELIKSATSIIHKARHIPWPLTFILYFNEYTLQQLKKFGFKPQNPHSPAEMFDLVLPTVLLHIIYDYFTSDPKLTAALKTNRWPWEPQQESTPLLHSVSFSTLWAANHPNPVKSAFSKSLPTLNKPYTP